ncbi:energy-coupled thiamine transporter ThiT [Peptoniphilus equinus]|uniref:Energy-coupled thiamine transporter ThiT n=1 Tax=Peptoniphilus equinus TaxID=3016343 RepID=A0ABY7QTR6_9FIRM|nr:energy-coupled thiamine transporter ThiT [Peptoniphilus equinus]WBW50180.1 energy-coupled thiamine transporter ThiT [Peptoniphilus equinus]
MKPRTLAYAGVAIALSQILSYIKFLEMPQGGSVTLGSMVPLTLFALMATPGEAFLAGGVYGILQLVLSGAPLYHPLSLLLDYILPFGSIAVVSCFTTSKSKAVMGLVIAFLLRYLSHFLSGWLLFGSYAPEGQAPWLYSAVYNASVLVEMLLTVVIVYIVYDRVVPRLRRNA